MKSFEIKLDKARKLVYNNRALYELEDKVGMPIMLLFQDQNKLSSIRTISILIWAGLLKEYNLTLDEVIDIIPPEKTKENIVIVIRALGIALGVTDEAVDEELDKLKKKNLSKA
ncbi:MAG: hypothetical protein ACUZ8H_13115 [Candidatus Anammoxibacter sp.]